MILENCERSITSNSLKFKFYQAYMYYGMQELMVSYLFIYLFKARLDKVAEAGLPIWITELSVASDDDTLKGTCRNTTDSYIAQPSGKHVHESIHPLNPTFI